tara:strand:+ start:82 stop:513 length:432 start_codon:yes stop_codon:yes gene_type:complete
MALKSTKPKRRPFDYRKKKLLSKGRNQAPLVVPDIGKVRTGSPRKIKKTKQSDAIADFGKAIAGAAGKKKMPGLDNKIFKSVTGDIVGTEEAFADAEIPLLNYIEGYDGMKKGGSIKKKMKKKKTKSKKRGALRGQGVALRGF